MPVVIQRIEDLAKIAQLTTGALFYCSQSGTAFNTNPSDMINCISGANVFLTTTSGQVLLNLISLLNGNNIVYTTGNQVISGNKTFVASLLDTNGVSALTTNSRQLYDANPNGVLDWANRTLNNPGVQAVNWSGYTMKDSSNSLSTDWNNKVLYGTSGLIAVDWTSRILYDLTGNIALSWQNRTLFNSWIFTGPIKSNQDSNNSIETNPRQLKDATGNISVLWSSRNLSGNWKLNGTGIATSSELALTGTNLQNQINNLLLTGGVGVVPSINFSTNIDWSTANTFFSTFSGNSKTVTFSNTLDGQTVVVGFSGFTTGAITWPTNVKWPNNLPPSPSSGAIDIYTFVRIKTGIYGTAVQSFPL